jgi:hypothetical protein
MQRCEFIKLIGALTFAALAPVETGGAVRAARMLAGLI